MLNWPAGLFEPSLFFQPGEPVATACPPAGGNTHAGVGARMKLPLQPGCNISLFMLVTV